MALHTCKVYSNGIKTAFFLKKKLQKVGRATINRPDPIANCGWSPQKADYDKFKLQWFIQHVSQFRHFHFSNFRFKPRLLIFHSTTSLSHKTFLFRKVLITSLHVMCDLPPPPPPSYPNQKFWLRL